MGIKRPLEEDILEQLDYNKKLICNTEESHIPIPRVDSPGIYLNREALVLYSLRSMLKEAQKRS